MLDDLLQHALEGLQLKAQLDTGSLPKKAAAMQPAMKVRLSCCCRSFWQLSLFGCFPKDVSYALVVTCFCPWHEL